LRAFFLLEKSLFGVDTITERCILITKPPQTALIDAAPQRAAPLRSATQLNATF
jgi:hypothetical protein